MIDHAWAWAKLHGKHFKHPINQAEYIEIELDTEREKKTTKGTELETSVAFTLEDCGHSCMHAFILAIHLHVFLVSCA